MPARKKTSKKTPEKKNSRKKTSSNEIPILTRRAVTRTAEQQHEPATVDENPGLGARRAQEIRALVTEAVNESVPKIIERIMDKLIPPK